MSEEAKAAKEIAKAVQETAKVVPAVLDAGTDLGKWVAGVLGTLPEDIVGLALGDYVGELRIRNLDRIRRRTDAIHATRGVQNPQPISPNRAIPAFEAASEESDETLQDLWAALLANAMDPNREVPLDRIFIETLKSFEPLDARVLQHYASAYAAENIDGRRIDWTADRLHIRPSLAEVSIRRLGKLDCLRHEQGIIWAITALGQELLTACQRDGEDDPPSP